MSEDIVARLHSPAMFQQFHLELADDGQSGRNDSGGVAMIRAALSIPSPKHLGQPPQSDGADQAY